MHRVGSYTVMEGVYGILPRYISLVNLTVLGCVWIYR
jgi:hypothetical protein